jgi:fucose permease
VIMGAVADNIGVHYSLIIPLISYLYLAFYGANGYKPYKMKHQ